MVEDCQVDWTGLDWMGQARTEPGDGDENQQQAEIKTD